MLLRLSLLCLLLQELLPTTGASESGIIGGERAKPHSRPYMASLQINKSHSCGGFLIRKDFVMTAAHCMYTACKGITVVLGGYDLSKTEASQQRIQAESCYVHPGNALEKLDYDIALIKLRKNATLNKYVKSIELPRQGEDVLNDSKCLIPGWGMTNPSRSAENILREVTLPMRSSKDCKDLWRQYFIPRRMLCTHFDGKNGICQGDSGGPLICKNKAHGIASLTAMPCTARYPSIYTKVSFFIPWIQKKMSQDH